MTKCHRGSTVRGARAVVVLRSEFCLTTQHLLGGDGGGSDSPPPPPLGDCAKFSPGLRPIKNYFWRLWRKLI